MIYPIDVPAYGRRAHFQYIVGTGLNGGGYTTAATWQQRPINTTVFNEIAGCSLAANSITVPPGRYHLICNAHIWRTGMTLLRIYDETDAAQLTHSSTGNNYYSEPVRIASTEEFDVETTLHIDMLCEFASLGQGMGQPIGLGDDEIYFDLWIQKIY